MSWVLGQRNLYLVLAEAVSMDIVSPAVGLGNLALVHHSIIPGYTSYKNNHSGLYCQGESRPCILSLGILKNAFS